MRKIHLIWMILLLAITGCKEVAFPPAGSYSEVLLVTDMGERSEWGALVTPLIEREHDYVTSIERAFDVTQLRAAQLDDFPTFKNIVLCGVLDTDTAIGKRIRDLIGNTTASRVMRGNATILKKTDLPAPGQLTLIITAPSNESLDKVISDRGEEIADILEASCRERLRKHLMSQPAKKVSDNLKRDYGFTLEIPRLYKLLSDDQVPPGIELIREPPTRLLGIFWNDRKEPLSIYRPDEIFDLRAEYVWRRYDHDKMDRDKVRYSYTRLGPYDALRMSGYWYNDDDVVGGYFETYFLHDLKSELLWAVDILTFAPGRKKHPLIRELKAIAETFRYN